MSKAAAAPSAERREAMVVGMSWIEAVLSTTKRHSSSEAGPPRPAMARAARIPAGVAALPKPRRFALTFSETAAISSRSIPAFGKSRFSRGPKALARAAEIPQRSISSITPLHRQTPPESAIQKRSASSAPSMTAAPAAWVLPETGEKRVEKINKNRRI